jgi:hypothetical protein
MNPGTLRLVGGEVLRYDPATIVLSTDQRLCGDQPVIVSDEAGNPYIVGVTPVVNPNVVLALAFAGNWVPISVGTARGPGP